MFGSTGSRFRGEHKHNPFAADEAAPGPQSYDPGESLSMGGGSKTASKSGSAGGFGASTMPRFQVSVSRVSLIVSPTVSRPGRVAVHGRRQQDSQQVGLREQLWRLHHAAVSGEALLSRLLHTFAGRRRLLCARGAFELPQQLRRLTVTELDAGSQWSPLPHWSSTTLIAPGGS